MKELSEEYWNNRYLAQQTGWDIGCISPPMKAYFDQLTDKSLRILVPGAGNAWEVEYLYDNGFHNTFLLDFAEESIRNFKSRCPQFPDANILREDFFTHRGQYDLVIEQTFFSSLRPERRMEYAARVYNLLVKGGRLAGLLFSEPFGFEGPPFGGTPSEYEAVFSKYFEFKAFSLAYNSIKPRSGRELFILLTKS